jgi:GAF domain-containing protein
VAHPQDDQIAKLLRMACEIADAHAGSLFLVKGEVLLPYAIYNLPEDYVAGIGEVRVGSQCCGRAVESRKPWIVTDMLQDPLFADGRKGAANSLIRAAFSVPVFQDDEVIGSLACHFTQPHTPTAVDIDRNEHFARLIAITLKGRGVTWPRAPIFAGPSGELPVNRNSEPVSLPAE